MRLAEIQHDKAVDVGEPTTNQFGEFDRECMCPACGAELMLYTDTIRSLHLDCLTDDELHTVAQNIKSEEDEWDEQLFDEVADRHNSGGM